jgi:hypothetical protein
MGWPNDLSLHKAWVILYVLAATVLMPTSLLVATPVDEDAATAQNLAAMLRAGWTVISKEQSRINDPALGAKTSRRRRVLTRTQSIQPLNPVDFSATRWTRSSK